MGTTFAHLGKPLVCERDQCTTGNKGVHYLWVRKPQGQRRTASIDGGLDGRNASAPSFAAGGPARVRAAWVFPDRAYREARVLE